MSTFRTRTRTTPPPSRSPEYEAWLDGIVRPSEGAEMCNCSEDTLKKRLRAQGKLLNLGPRALGARRRDILMLD
jgi:hypothetical protein